VQETLKLSPTIIRPQLIPFLFKEFSGNEARYNSKTAKTIVFLPSSSITSYLYTQINYKKTTQRQDRFIFWLTIDEKQKQKYHGLVYIEVSGVKEALLMEEFRVRDFNNLLEDMFRVSMIFFVDGCVDCGLSVPKAIEKFIDKYDLLEVGFDIEALRVLYFREKKTPNLFRFQSKSANRVYNYA
jgi:hypothetical protein